MAYTVLARRYRSQSFGSVVGQETIATTLINAIRSDRVAHAYLFCGTRGVGKTSMARIFARGLNAPATVDDAPTPEDNEYPEPDVQQRMATAIMRGEDLNVIEIDGASNNSVDQARQLIANAGLSPTANALYKIYIIDEVHMLSGAAFNALLKTMEEPPSHVKFILCTTEPHKIPATIQSRCQRFDFRNIATAKIAEHLADVLKNEAVEAEPEVLWQVARLGNGSMRDALSLMDRLLATGESPLTAKTLQEMLGLPDHQLIAALVDAMATGDVKASLTNVAGLLNRGIGQDQLVEVIIERLRQLMLIAACGADSELIELSEDAKTQAVEQAQRFDAAGLVHMIALCENLQRFGKSSSNPRALLDATVVRLTLAEKMADVSAVLTGGASLPRSAAGSPAAGAPGGYPGGHSRGHSGDEKKKLAADRPAPAPAATPTASSFASSSSSSSSSQPPSATGFTPGKQQPAPAASASPTPSLDLATATPASLWAAVLDTVGRSNAAAWMDHFNLTALDTAARPAVATLAATMTFAGGIQNVATGPRLNRVTEAMTQLLGCPVRIELADAAAPDALKSAQGSAHGQDVPETQAQQRSVDRRDALNLPLVRDVFEVFPDASLIDARKETPPPNDPPSTNGTQDV